MASTPVLVGPPALRAQVARLYPGAEVVSIEPLGADSGATAGASSKAAGYGLPVRLVVDDHGVRRELVWRTASINEFGHERRADRAAGMIQAFDDFGATPDHVEAVDLGVVLANGQLTSIRGATEHYLITTYAPGTIYAEQLREIARTGVATTLDLHRIDALAQYLARLHTPLRPPGTRYRRAIRDLIGTGEGIFGIIDGYPPDVPGAPATLLADLEARCARWRWRLRDKDHRLTRTHGDFHPFNIVFSGPTPTFLDASRGGCGEPADDLTALAINFLLFAIDRPAAWAGGLGVLWRHLWEGYLIARPDPELLEVAPPFLMWRTLVVCNPRFYPALPAEARARLLAFAAEALDAHVLDLSRAEALFR